MILPNLVLGGAPRCGTSSVFRWLAAHPQVGTSKVKETFYLLDAEHPLRREPNYQTGGLAGYAELFSHCPADCSVVFEATAHYLYSETARRVLADLPSRPTVLFLLRRPADRIYSSFRYTRDTLAQLPRSLDFAAFLDRVRRADRAPVTADRATGTFDILGREIEYSHYHRYIDKWFTGLGQDRVVVALFEHMVADPEAFVRDLCQRLGIDPGFYADSRFEAHNASVAVRSPTIHRLVRRLVPLLPLGTLRGKLKGAYLGVAAASMGRTSGAPSTATRHALIALEAEFAGSNQRLADLTGLDLAPWLQGSK